MATSTHQREIFLGILETSFPLGSQEKQRVSFFSPFQAKGQGPLPRKPQRQAYITTLRVKGLHAGHCSTD